MNRRYFSASIHELETLFENRKDDGSVLKALEEELAHRKTERAAKLRHRVAMRLTQLGTCTSASTLLVSTTFASVNRMLGKLPPESLGWLLVDEAPFSQVALLEYQSRLLEFAKT